MSQRMPSIRPAEKSVPLRIKYLSIKDITVEINDIRYQLGVCRDYPNGDVPQYVKSENALGGVGYDFDRFGFEIPIGSDPILPGDVPVRNENPRVMQTDTDELEELFQTELTRCEILLRIIAEKESGIESKLDKSWNTWMPQWRVWSKNDLQLMVERSKEQLELFHCKRHNLPPPFNCYIQLSTMEDGEATPLQRLVYNRKLYEAVKQFNHILFANRPVIRVNELVCLANQVYRIPVGVKIKANELTLRRSQIASIAPMIEGDVNTLRVFRWENAENWWQHRLVKNAKELITEDSFLMLSTLGNQIIRFHNRRTLTVEQYCDLIENWISVKREVGSELWIGLRFKRHRESVIEMIQTRMKVVRRNER
ncbi:unnamed protein product [Caenorhabditis nigoni]